MCDMWLDGKLIEQDVYHISLHVIAIATHQDKYNRIVDKNSASIVPLCSLSNSRTTIGKLE